MITSTLYHHNSCQEAIIMFVLFFQLLHRSARVICERDTKSHARHIPFYAPANAQRLTKDSHNTGNFMPCSLTWVLELPTVNIYIHGRYL